MIKCYGLHWRADRVFGVAQTTPESCWEPQAAAATLFLSIFVSRGEFMLCTQITSLCT